MAHLDKTEISKITFSSKDKIKGLSLPEKVSRELAYLCGVFMGDGSIYNRISKKEHVLKCVGNPKDEQAFYFKIIGPYFRKVFGFLPSLRYYDSNTTFGFSVYSKALFDFLTKIIGLPSGKKYSLLKIPFIFKKDKLLVINVLRGLFDTDGCITFKKNTRKHPTIL